MLLCEAYKHTHTLQVLSNSHLSMYFPEMSKWLICKVLRKVLTGKVFPKGVQLPSAFSFAFPT